MKINLNTKLYPLFIYMLFLLVTASCSDEPKNPDDDPSIDPAGTISLSMRDIDNGDTKLGSIGIRNENLYGAFFTDFGEIQGLKDINSIPKSGWSDEIRITPGHGYVAFDFRINKYYRIFATDFIKDSGANIIGAYIKYQEDFKGSDEEILLSETAISFGPDGGDQALFFDNKSLLLYNVESSEPWCQVVKASDLSYPFLFDGIVISISPNGIYGEKEATITITTVQGKTKNIHVTFGADPMYFKFGDTSELKDISYRGGEFSIGFTTNCFDQLHFEEHESWIEYSVRNSTDRMRQKAANIKFLQSRKSIDSRSFNDANDVFALFVSISANKDNKTRSANIIAKWGDESSSCEISQQACFISGEGTTENPFDVPSAIHLINTNEFQTAWVKGYIVGAVAPDVSIVKMSSDIEWTAPTVLANTIVIAPDKETKDPRKCLIVPLAPDSPLRRIVNLHDNPKVIGSEITIKGYLSKYMGAFGIIDNTGSYGEFISSSSIPLPPDPLQIVTKIDENFNASTNIPAGWTKAQIAGNKRWYMATFNGNNYAAMTGYKGTAPFDQWLITPPVDMSAPGNWILSFDTQVNGYGSITTNFEVYILNESPEKATTKIKLNPILPNAPESGYSDWVFSGNINLSNYKGLFYIGFRYTATEETNYATWCIDNVKLDIGNGGGNEPVNPPTPPTGGDTSDFNTFNGGTLSATYGSYTNSTGWTATNAQILAGNDGAEDSRTNFKMFGGTDVYAVCLNGRYERNGVLKSSILSKGCKILSFNFGHPYADTKYSLTVNVKQGDKVAYTKTLDGESAKGAVQTATLEVNVTGQFVIEIVNNGPSNKADGNKDRVAIWNLVWTR